MGKVLLEAIKNVLIGPEKKSAIVLDSPLMCLTSNFNLERDSAHLANCGFGISPSFRLSISWRYL